MTVIDMRVMILLSWIIKVGIVAFVAGVVLGAHYGAIR